MNDCNAGKRVVEKNSAIDELAKIIWEYLLMHQPLEKADAIMILGTHDPSVAFYGADLFLQNWAPNLILTGGVLHPADVFQTDSPVTEAEYFLDVALKKGVPREKIFVENEAKNTGENFEKTATILKSTGFQFNKFILVQKPYTERRTFATGKKQWPDKELIVTSPPITYEEYITSGIPKDRIISTMVGDLQRIKLYPARGFQIPQTIPLNVWEAFEKLVALGFDQRLIK